LTTPISKEVVATLNAGDRLLLTGIIYTARDAAHKKLQHLLDNGDELPFNIDGAVLYYTGPSPVRPGDVTGSAGPTTSCRMDLYTPDLLKAGLTGMIGKGKRGDDVSLAMQQYGAVYFAATGGAGALLALSIKKSRIIAYPELGAEAIRELVVSDFPVIVAQDAFGKTLYK